MQHVVDFVQMQRFEDPLLVEVLKVMRTPGGQKISEAAWRAMAVEVLEAMRTPGGKNISEAAWGAIAATKITEDRIPPSPKGPSQATYTNADGMEGGGCAVQGAAVRRGPATGASRGSAALADS